MFFTCGFRVWVRARFVGRRIRRNFGRDNMMFLLFF